MGIETWPTARTSDAVKAESVITKDQKKASEYREKGLSSVEKIDKDIINEILKLEKKVEYAEHNPEILLLTELRGQLNGHDVILQKKDPRTGNGFDYIVTIDGARAPRDTEEQLVLRILNTYENLNEAEKISSKLEKFEKASESDIAAYELLAKL